MTGSRRYLLLFYLLFLIVLLRTAWVGDDAYISFRVVDNFVHGHGLRFNVSERVQTYTNPLWVLLMAPAYLFTGEIFLTSIALSVLASLWVVHTLVWKLEAGEATSLLVALLLCLSCSFVDYSTSGLENPLSHLLIALFARQYLRGRSTVRACAELAGLAALGALGRLDDMIFFVFPLLYVLFEAAKRSRLRASLGAMALGFVPLIAWLLFALLYYGSVFPNTAHAKLNVAAPRAMFVQHGFYYLLNMLHADPLTLAVIVAGIAVPCIVRNWKVVAVAAGIVLDLLYILYTGGDHMSGRFLTSSFVCALVCLLGCRPLPVFDRRWAVAAALCVTLGFAAAQPTLLSDEHFAFAGGSAASNGISDERRVWYPGAGLLRLKPNRSLPDNKWVEAGKKHRERGPHVVVTDALGYLSFFAGPGVHVIDEFALADPLLARIPARAYRTGHNRRALPPGYLKTLRKGHNFVNDGNLRKYYDKLRLVTRADLFAPGRLAAIWGLNTGSYDHLLEEYTRTNAYRQAPGLPE